MSDKRTFVAVLHRRKARGEGERPRHYANIINALRRSTERALLECGPGDLVEIFHSGSELQVATIKVSASGQLRTSWAEWLIEEFQRERRVKSCDK